MSADKTEGEKEELLLSTRVKIGVRGSQSKIGVFVEVDCLSKVKNRNSAREHHS